MAKVDFTLEPFELPTDEELVKYDGSWVAIHQGRIVASAKSARAVINKAVHDGFERACIVHLPLGPPAGKAAY